MPRIIIDRERCVKDGLCVEICRKVFSQKTKDSVPEVVNEAFCNDCGHCVLICPSGAMSQTSSPRGGINPVMSDLIPSYEQVLELIRSRRSIRTFNERPVEQEVIEKIIHCARYAPTAKNTQSTSFIVIRDKTMLHTIASGVASWLGRAARKLSNPLIKRIYLLRGAVNAGEVARLTGQFEMIAKRMGDGEDLVLFGAPALILFHADKQVRFAEANANLAVQNAMLATHSLRLGSFYTGYAVTAFNNDKTMAELVSLPRRHRIYGGMALGYPKIMFTRWIERDSADIRWM